MQAEIRASRRDVAEGAKNGKISHTPGIPWYMFDPLHFHTFDLYGKNMGFLWNSSTLEPPEHGHLWDSTASVVSLQVSSGPAVPVPPGTLEKSWLKRLERTQSFPLLVYRPLETKSSKMIVWYYWSHSLNWSHPSLRESQEPVPVL